MANHSRHLGHKGRPVCAHPQPSAVFLHEGGHAVLPRVHDHHEVCAAKEAGVSWRPGPVSDTSGHARQCFSACTTAVLDTAKSLSTCGCC